MGALGKVEKTTEWLSRPTTRITLVCAGLVMVPALEFMGKSFREARLDVRGDIVPYVSKAGFDIRNGLLKVCVDVLLSSDFDGAKSV